MDLIYFMFELILLQNVWLTLCFSQKTCHLAQEILPTQTFLHEEDLFVAKSKTVIRLMLCACSANEKMNKSEG